MDGKTQNSFEDADHDVFNETAVAVEESEEVTQEVIEQDVSQEAEEPVIEQSGEKEEAEAPPAEAKEVEQQDHSEEMIPKHRFKAALKDVTDKLDAANSELARVNQQPAPDRATDPDGYDLHYRIETSKEMMADTHPDYGDMIAHYTEMEKANPMLAQIVSNHRMPAKQAYDLAKKDLEIRELSALKDSDDWSDFQTFKKTKAAQAKADAEAASAAAKAEQANSKQSSVEAISKVPNLNRATEVSKSRPTHLNDDEGLFEGAL